MRGEHLRVMSEKQESASEVSAGPYASNSRSIHLTNDVDEAMKWAVSNEDEGVHIDTNADKKLLWKIDLYLLPLVCLLYAFQYMDKVSISNAAVLGLRTDLNMEGDMYSWCGTVFYFGYLIFVFPASAMLQRFPMAKTSAAFIVLWGVVLACHAACNNYASFVVCRVLLGVFESGITPAMVILTGQWYKAEEQFLRTSIWFACNGAGAILSGAIGYGIVKHEDGYSMAAWKVLFLVMGISTIVVGIVFYLHVPDVPANAWFLTDMEKRLVVERIRSNEQGFGNKHFKKYQFREALTDIMTWIFFLYGIASCIPNGALTNFASILLNDDFDFTVTKTMLMNMPEGAVEIVGCILIAWASKFVGHRLLAAIFALAITLAASCMLAFAPENNARLAGLYLQYLSPVPMICILSLFASNTAGHTKKITVNAIYLIGYCAGNIVGPQTFISTQAPGYIGGKIAFIVCWSAGIVLLAWGYIVYLHRNNVRSKQDEQPEEIENHEFADLTDLENPYFKYAL